MSDAVISLPRSYFRAPLWALLLCAASAAQTATWTGAVDANWSNGANWSGGTAPTATVNAVVAATATAPSTAGVVGAACDNLTVQAGATLTLAAGSPLSVHGNLTTTGTVAGADRIVMAGGSAATILAGTGSVAALEIAKAAATVNVSAGTKNVAGDLTIASGTLTFSNSATMNVGGALAVNGGALSLSGLSTTLNVAGTATFAGGTYSASSSSATDVDGAATFAGTAAAGALGTIRCGGDFTFDPAFAPTSGTVVFDGAAPQAILGTGTTFSGLTVSAGSTVTTALPLPNLNGNLTVNGALTMTNPAATIAVSGSVTVGAVGVATAAAALDVGASLTVSAGGALNLGGGTHTVGDNLTVNGTVGGGGTFRMDGGGTATLSGSGAIAALEIAKAAATVNVSAGTRNVAGDLTIASGTLTFSNSATMNVGGVLVVNGGALSLSGLSSTLNVAGTATFAGGTYSASSSSATDVDGAVTFAGTAAAGALGTIRCGGDFTFDPAFAPTSGALVCDGAAPQAILGTGTTLPGLTVSAGSTVTTALAIPNLNGNLTVNGALTMTNPAATIVVTGSATVGVAGVATATALLDVGGSVTVSAGGVLNLGAGTHTVGDNLTVSGTVGGGGTFRMDGGGSANLLVPGSIAALEVAKSGGTVTATSGTTNVAGNLTIASGTLTLSNSATLSVGGALTQTGGALSLSGLSSTLNVAGTATLAGGTFSASSSATTDVAGAVVFAGASAAGAVGTVRCGGDWTYDAAFAPTSGTVVFDGGVPQAILGTGTTFSGLTVNAGSTVTTALAIPNLNGNLTVNGALTMTNPAATVVVTGNATVGATGTCAATALLDVGGSVTVSAGGVLTLGAGTHTVGDNLTVSGTVGGGGTFRMDGGGSASVSAPGSIAALEIAKSGGAVNVSSGTTNVAGNLTIASGTLTLSNSATLSVGGALTQTGGALSLSGLSSTLNVAGTATLAGGTFSASSSATTDVAGAVVFAGASAAGAVGTVRCGGDWTYDAAFAPTSGTVVFDGGVPQAILGTGTTFSGLSVNAGSTVTTALAIPNLNGNLTVNGALTMTNPAATIVVTGSATVGVAGVATATALLDVGGSVTVSAGGVLNLGAGVHTVGDNLTVSGTVGGGGTFRMDGGGSANLLAPGSIAALEVAKSGGTVTATSGTTNVAGNLTLTSGTLSTNNSATINVGGALAVNGGTFNHAGLSSTFNVNGAATFAGGTFSASPSAALDVGGAATFSGTTAAGAVGTLRCGGDWTSDAGFAPTSGTLEFDGAAPTTIAVSPAGAALALPAVVVKNGARTVLGAAPFTASSTNVQSGAALRAGAGTVLAFATTAPTVNGTLGSDAGGTIALGPTTNLVVPAAGKLSLVGSPTNPATLTSFGGPGYGATVNGTVEAMNARIEFMGAAGFVVAQSATIAPAPKDLRNVFFDNPFSPTSCLLDVRRNAPADLRYCVFEKSNGVNAFNVRCTTGAAVSLTNWAGTLAGEAQDDDPTNLVTWNPPEETTPSLFAAIPGVAKATALWQLFDVVDAEAFVLERSDAGGPFAVVHETPAAGLGPYAFVDQPLTPLTTYDYKLFQRLTHGVLVELGTASATPFVVPPPANVLEVGPGGGVADLQAGVNAALAAAGQITVLRVAPGTYAPFTVSATPPGGLRIVADGPGATIDTTNASVVVENLTPADAFELRGFALGSASTARTALVVRDCQAPVILDALDLAAAGAPAATVERCFKGVSLTRSTAVGAPGVRVSQSSTAAVAGAGIASLALATGAYVQTCGVGGAVTNDGSAIREDYPGATPEVSAPAFLSIGTPLVVDFAGAPLSYWALVGAFGADYVAYPASILQMPQLVPLLGIFFVVESGADGAGAGQYQNLFPPDPNLLGLAITWQAVQFDFAAPAGYRLSNSALTVAVL